MKVALISATFLPLISGTTTYIDNLAINLSKKGINVTVLSPNFFKNNKEYYDFVITRPYKFICLKTIHFIKESYFSSRLFVYLFRNNFDIIHVNLLYPFGTELALLTKFFKKTTIIATLHNFRFDDNIITKVYENSFQNIYFKYIEAVIVTTDYYKKLVKHISKINSFMIPIGLADIFWDDKNFNLKPDFPYPYVLYVGLLASFQPYKRINFLFNVFKEFSSLKPEFHLIIIGDGDKRKNFENYCKLIGIEQKVHFLGKIENNNLAKYYSNTRCFFFPSSKETFGIPIIEAASQGAIVLARYLPIYKELHSNLDYISYYYNENVVDVATLLSKTIEVQPTIVQKKIQKNKIYNLYSWEKITTRTINLYKVKLIKRTRNKKYKNERKLRFI